MGGKNAKKFFAGLREKLQAKKTAHAGQKVRTNTREAQQLRRFLKKLSQLHSWQLLIILFLCGFITATFFRFDHLKMNELKETVLSADESGDTEELNSALSELKNFVFSHTVWTAVEENGETSLALGTGVFYLENSYLRDAEAAIEEAEEKASSPDNPNGNVYATATAVCKPLAIANGWRWNSEGYLNCMTGQISQYPSYDYLADITADVPSTELYRVSYASPILALTGAGVMTIIDAILILWICARVLIRLILNLALIFLRRKS